MPSGASVCIPLWRAISAVGSGMFVMVMQLVERRGHTQMSPQRHVELSTLLDSIPDPVFLFDEQGRLVDCNILGEQLCDRSRQMLAGISINDFNSLLSARDENDRPVETPSMGVIRALNGEVVQGVRRVFRHPEDGRVVDTITSASPIRDQNGTIKAALLIVRDVTEIFHLQRRLADTQRHREVGQMAAGLAHDFNNVLDTIIQAATLLELSDHSPPEQRRTYLGLIRNAVGRGAEIIDRVRDYLRSGSGQQNRVDMRQVLEDVIELTQPLWHVRQEVKVSKRLQPVSPVWANAADLRRVFTNLVINALEAMPAGGQLLVSCEPAGHNVRVVISDTGQGISPEQQKQIFVPYFTTKPQGTGLGLSGAQRIVNSMRGHIDFRSEVGKGTSFVVDMPAADKTDAEPRLKAG